MICKITDKRSDGGSSFKSLCSYMATGKKAGQEETTERVKYSGTRNLVSEKSDLRGIYEEMWLTSLKNSRVVDPVVHAIISWPEGEEPSEEQCREAVEIYAQEHGLGENQCYWALHEDTDNFHLHICFNRVDIETHRAVDLGLYKISNERSARKIEIAQGWQHQEGKFFEIVEQVNDQGEKVLVVQDKKRSKERRSISTKARDIEGRTGEMSAERTAQEVAAPIIYMADTWATLHAQLAEQGIRLEQKGSGGLLWIGDTAVKLSTAGRQCSMKKLIARLGQFEARDPAVAIKEFKPQTLARDTADEQSLVEYNKQRREFYIEKKKAKAEIDAWIKDRRVTFAASKKERRQKMYSKGWKGRKDELRQARSLLAYQFAVEAERLREEIKERRRRYRELYARWAKYEEWLRQQQKDLEADLWRYRHAEGIIFGAVAVYQIYDIEKFRPERTGRVVTYRSADGRTAFVDRGQLISVTQWHNDEAVRASLQIAAAKWKIVNVQGSAEFIERSIRAAAELGIQLRDPEMQRRVEELRKEFFRNERDSMGGNTDQDNQQQRGGPGAETRDLDTALRELETQRREASELARDSELERKAREAEQQRLAAETSRRTREQERRDQKRESEIAARESKTESKGHGGRV